MNTNYGSYNFDTFLNGSNSIFNQSPPINNGFSSFMNPNFNAGITDNFTLGGVQPVTGFNTGQVPVSQQPSMFDIFKTEGAFDIGKIASGVNAAAGIAQTFAGFKNMRTARNQLAFQKEAFQRNFAEQKRITDMEIAERARRRANASQ